jgi:asparagine synthase (glutamine-hydrolysing)
MLASIGHRGTVDGFWQDAAVALGSRRLPIIDVEHSPQPIFSEDRGLVLIGNGEIYNFRELRSELRSKGHTFATGGDLECILHLYEERGADAWNRLRGMFAVALYDRRTRTLRLARDPMGVKPLFYAECDGALLFGSEIKSVAAHPAFSRELNPQAVADYLSLQFVPKPDTIYRGLLGLPPASVLTARDRDVSVRTYWSIDPRPSAHAWTRESVAERTLDLLRQSVKRRLISDVPLGVLLSGGLDSSVVAALASEQTRAPVRTFSIVFRERTFDESRHSRLLARHLQTDHHELTLDSRAILDVLDETRHFFDEPFCEGSAFPIYLISRYARDHVTVLLSGEGSDEIFCGYEPYAAWRVARRYARLPARLRGWIASLADRLPVSDNKVSLDLKLRRFTAGSGFPPPKAHFWYRCSMNDDEKRRVLSEEFLKAVPRPETSRLYEERYAALASDDILNRIMAVDCSLHLVDDLLLRADRMSMAHTLEMREPFLDVDLVNFAFSLGSERKADGIRNKIPLRDAAKGLIPEPIRRRRKQGLNMPYQKWFKQGAWRSALHDALAERSLDDCGLFNTRSVRAFLAEHEAGRRNHAHALWAIMNLVLWLRRGR